MTPDPAFQKALSRMDKKLFAVWHPKKHRWQIRYWLLPHTRHAGRNYYEWRTRSTLVRTVCYLDGEGYDIGYHPLDARVLYALKLSYQMGLNPHKTARMVDESNAKLEAEWAAGNEAIAKETATAIWNHYREATVDYGQQSAR